MASIELHYISVELGHMTAMSHIRVNIKIITRALLLDNNLVFCLQRLITLLQPLPFQRRRPPTETGSSDRVKSEGSRPTDKLITTGTCCNGWARAWRGREERRAEEEIASKQGQVFNRVAPTSRQVQVQEERVKILIHHSTQQIVGRSPPLPKSGAPVFTVDFKNRNLQVQAPGLE